MRLVTSRSGSALRSRFRRSGPSGIALVFALTFAAATPAGAATRALPDAPVITSAVAGVQNATISFRKSANDGGGRIFAYRAKCTSTDGVFTYVSNSAKSPVMVGHLSVRKTYICRVAAHSTAGLGPYSDPSAPIIPQVSPHRAVPAPFTSAHARALPEGVRVAFGALAYSVIGRITMTRAVCTSTDGGHAGSAKREHAGSILVSPLTIGKTYTCYGQARNVYGWGSASPRSSAVVVLPPRLPPSAPTITSVVPTLRTVTVTFRPPDTQPGEHLYPYRATCTSSDGGASSTRAGARSPIAVTGLSLSKTYTCTVTAHSGLGWGRPSEPSDAVVTPGAT